MWTDEGSSGLMRKGDPSLTLRPLVSPGPEVVSLQGHGGDPGEHRRSAWRGSGQEDGNAEAPADSVPRGS